MKGVFSIRLKQARQMRGLSMDRLSERVNHALSKQSIAKYESGKMMPDSQSLIALASALDLPIDYLLRPIGYDIEHIEFRKKSNLGEKRVLSIKAEVRDKVERYVEVESLYDMHEVGKLLSERTLVTKIEDVYPICSRFKQKWQVGEDGINNLIEILEDNGLKIIEIDAESSFDGLSGYANENIPFIVLNANFISERKRFTALHELGHLVMCFPEDMEKREKEKLCNLFASEMLISRNVLFQKLGQKRGDISLRELIDIQRQFGISVDALMYKARFEDIISENRYKVFQKKKNYMPDFKRDVEKSRFLQESSGRMERLVYRALADELISISRASVLLGKSVNEVREELVLV